MTLPPRFHRAMLVIPPTGLYRRDDRCQSKVEDQTVQIIFPPIELAAIGAVLRAAGVSVQIRDYPALGAGRERYLADLREFRPDMLLVSVTTATAEQDFAALAAANDILGAGSVWTLAKGEYMDALGESAMATHPEIDVGFHGEIEQTLARFHAGEPLETLPGLIWRRAAPCSAPQTKGIEASGREAHDGTGEIIRNPGHPLLEDLDSLPWPARDLLDNALYRSPETGNALTVIHGNRGCPAHCIFCPAGAMSGYRVRYRSPENIVNELRECVERFGLREFLFHGDTFTINKKWLLELCERITAAGLRIRWGCNSRVDTMDDERAAAMRRAGCWVVAFGVETGDQAIMDRMKKGQRVERAAQAIEICKRHGLRTHAFYVIGTPWETRVTLAKTLALARRLDTDFFDFNIATPLPGTELFDIARAEGLTTEAPDPAADAAPAGYATAGIRTYELTPGELNRWRRRALLALYLRPRYVARMLWRAGSPRIALNYLKAGARRFGQLVRG